MKKLMMGLAAAVCCGCAFWEGAKGPGVSYVDEFDLSNSSCGMGLKVRPRTSVAGTPIVLAGKTFTRGFGTRPESAIAFKLDGDVKAFDAVVGIDAAAKAANTSKRGISAVIKVWVDEKVAVERRFWGEGKQADPVHVDLAGAHEVVLETVSTAPWSAFEAAHVDWADARFTIGEGGCVRISDEDDQFAQLGILTPPEKAEPQFNGAEVWGVRPGHPVIFRVPVTGVRPMTFAAKGLPAGVTFDAAKGVLGGVAPAKAGDYPIEVTAENAEGKATRTITLKVGETIALTPPMGWNSWNIWSCSFTGEHAKNAAKAMDESGLANHGWAYINLDDWWEMNNSGNENAKKRPEVIGPARDAKGKIIPNPSFPDMKGMTDYIHSLGLKVGLYSSPGRTTCGGCEGSLGHEMQDAESWADWGFDYIKYDWCSYGEVFKKESGWDTWEWMGRDKSKPLAKPAPVQEHFSKPYYKMRDCLRAQKRDILYSFCQYGIGEAEKWVRDAGANCWRSWQDLKDTWPWMETAIEGYVPNAEHWKYTGPGCWADPDMMIVGLQKSFGSTHPTYLTPNEQYTHVSIWALVCSPMLIGCDLMRLDPFTKSLLVNDEVIAISQDTLGRPARRYRHEAIASVWARPLANGDWAVGIVNRFPLARDITVDLKDFGLSGEFKVRDCWRQADEGTCEGTYRVRVLPHATKLVRLSAVR